MHTIVYASTANETFSDDELADLLNESRETNERLDLTGALLYRNGRFAQILEGPEKAVRAVYASIVADSRHCDISLVVDDAITVRKFADWTMAYRPAANSSVKSELFDHLADIAADDLAVEPSVISSSKVVTTIFDKIMADVRSGLLQPGDRMNDGDIAAEMGTSRTPVREALQMLRAIGVVEVSANRFTRVALVDADKAAQLLTVLIALYTAVLDEVVGHVSDTVIDAMQADHLGFNQAVAENDEAQTIGCSADFYMRLVEASENPMLKRQIDSVANAVRLGGPHLESLIGFRAAAASQVALLAALIDGDVARARRGLSILATPRG